MSRSVTKSFDRSGEQSIDRFSLPEKTYEPNVGKLLQWHGAANIVQDEAAKQLVLGLGRRLRDEFKATGVEGFAPRDYSSPNVTVSEDIRQQMENMATVARSVPAFDVETTTEYDIAIESEQTKRTDRSR